jgi:peptide/nickel transport system substrate-binding protein
MRARSLAVVALLASSLAAAGCAPRRQAAEEGVMVVSESEQTESFLRNFNPLLEVGDVRWPAKNSMYEPMLIHNPMTGAYVPWLAEAYHWQDGKLVFAIRHGVEWSDGQPFSAKDVAFTFGLLKKFEALDTRGVWRFLADVQATDEYTVEVSFRRPYVPGLFFIGQQPIVPEHIWKDVADPVSFANENPVATGPFTKVAWFRTQAYQIDRNPHYWQKGKPAVKSLRFIALPGNDQSVLALINGELDWIGDFVPAIDRIYVARDPEHNHYWFPLIDGMVMLYANTSKPPYDDEKVRKALSMSIDRDLIVEVAMHGYSKPADATGLNEGYARYRDPAAVNQGKWWVTHDPAAASKILDEAGFKRGADGWRHRPDGAIWEVNVNCPAGWTDWVRAAQVIAHGLQKNGIHATLRAYDYNTWFDRVQNGDFDLTVGWTEPGPTPYGLYRNLMSTETKKAIGEPSAENWHRYGSLEADMLLARLEQTLDPDEEMKLTHQLEMIFVEHAPAIPLFPGPLWGEFDDERFTGFPTKENPYAPLSPHNSPEPLLVLTELKPR